MTPDDPDFPKSVAFFDRDPEDAHFFRGFFTRRESLLFLPTENYAIQHSQNKNDKAMGLNGNLQWPEFVDHDYPLMALRATLVYFGIRAPGSGPPRRKMRGTHIVGFQESEEENPDPDIVFGTSDRYSDFPETYQLHGFQGKVMFDPHSESSFISAVQRLLSLPSETGAPYILLQYHADTPLRADDTLQSKYRFNLPGKSSDSPDKAYEVVQKLLWNTRGKLFVKTPEDEDPRLLEIAERRFTNSNGDVCYVPWSGISHRIPTDSRDLIAWRAYLETAFNVLVGEDDKMRFQCLLAKWQDPPTDITDLLEHVCVMFKPSFLEALDQKPELSPDQSSLLMNSFQWELPGSESAKGDLILPGYHPSDDEAIDLTLDGTPRELFFKAVVAVQKAFGTASKHIETLRLICATNVLDNSSAHPDDGLFEYDLKVCMRRGFEGLTPPDKKRLERMIQKCREDALPIFVHPVWNDPPLGPVVTQFVIGNVKTYRMALPRLGESSVADVWDRASLLRGFSLGWKVPGQTDTKKNDTCIKIKPVLFFNDDSKEYRAPPGLELETVYITPDMNSHDWFGIRARLTTQLYDVSLVSRQYVHSVGPFNARRYQTGYGPRYGPIYKHYQIARGRKARVIDPGAKPFFDQSSDSDSSSSGDDEPSHREAREEPKAKNDTQPKAPKSQAQAAPKRKVFPTPSNSLGTSPSLPKISKAIMTPTEQATLQQDHADLRHLQLTGTARCPMSNCAYTFQVFDTQGLARHFQTVHLGDKCPWCDTMAYASWEHEQRMKHISTRHRDILCAMIGVTDLANALPRMDEAQAPQQVEPVTGEKRPRRTGENDTAYRYSSDNDSADGLQPDVDDLVLRKRRRVEDPAFKPPQYQEAASEEEPLKTKKTAKAKAATTPKKTTPRKSTPKKATPKTKSPATQVKKTQTTPKPTSKGTATPEKKAGSPATPATPAAKKPYPGTPATTRVTRAAARAARGGD